MQPIADDAMAIPDKSLVQDSIDPDVSCLFLLLLSRITDGKYAIQKGFFFELNQWKWFSESYNVVAHLFVIPLSIFIFQSEKLANIVSFPSNIFIHKGKKKHISVVAERNREVTSWR